MKKTTNIIVIITTIEGFSMACTLRITSAATYVMMSKVYDTIKILCTVK